MKMGLRPMPREISLTGCPCVGKGKNGAVYRLDRDTIVKLFRMDEETAWRSAEQEMHNARTAYDLGVPTARSFDVVRCDGHPGIVFELLEAKSLRELVAAEPDRLEALVTKSAELLRTIHRIEVPKGAFPAIADTYRRRAENLDGWLTTEETEALCRVIASIPERCAYVHGDFHRGNLMVRGEDLLLIDMADSSTGHPFYDVLGFYTLGMDIVRMVPPAAVKRIIGWDVAEVQKEWDVFSRCYFRGRSDEERREVDAMLAFYAQMRQLVFLKLVPILTDEMRRQIVADARERFFPMVPGCIERFAPLMEGM